VTVGAVILGGDYQGLGIARSLGRRGVPVCVIDDERSIARFSRYTTHNVHVPSLKGEEETIAALEAIGGRLDLRGWVLYPTREETVVAFSRQRERLGELFRVPTPGWETIRWAWDKRNTYPLAEELGIPVPRTWYPRSVAELDAIDGQLPLVIKPAIKENFIYATKAKAWRVDSREQLRELYAKAAELTDAGEVMVQELIPGDGRHQFAYGAFFKDGRAIGSMVARRGRQHPPDFGRASTFAETVELPLLERLSERFLRRIDYYGLVEVEFKRDPRDGAFKLLDVNARTWGYHTLAHRAGVDFPYLLFADQVSEAVEECRTEPGVGWVRMLTDLPTVAVEIAGGRLTLREYLRSLRRVDTEAVFARDDPLPGLVECLLVPYLSVKRGF
jgi:predicted ATP-grasp superfamily ATP-dependent carboligase